MFFDEKIKNGKNAETLKGQFNDLFFVYLFIFFETDPFLSQYYID